MKVELECRGKENILFLEGVLVLNEQRLIVEFHKIKNIMRRKSPLSNLNKNHRLKAACIVWKSDFDCLLYRLNRKLNSRCKDYYSPTYFCMFCRFNAFWVPYDRKYLDHKASKRLLKVETLRPFPFNLCCLRSKHTLPNLNRKIQIYLKTFPLHDFL